MLPNVVGIDSIMGRGDARYVKKMRKRRLTASRKEPKWIKKARAGGRSTINDSISGYSIRIGPF